MINQLEKIVCLKNNKFIRGEIINEDIENNLFMLKLRKSQDGHEFLWVPKQFCISIKLKKQKVAKIEEPTKKQIPIEREWLDNVKKSLITFKKKEIVTADCTHWNQFSELERKEALETKLIIINIYEDDEIPCATVGWGDGDFKGMPVAVIALENLRKIKNDN